MRYVIQSGLRCSVLSTALLAALAGSALALPQQAPDAFQLGEPSLAFSGAARASREQQSCAALDPSLCLSVPALALLASDLLPRLSLEPPAAPAPTPVVPSAAPRAVGGELSLGNGRELSFQITPTPKRCAPLVKLTF